MTAVYLLMDPESRRISLQTNEPDESSFPRGMRGLSWPIRRGQLADDTYADLLAGRIDPAEQDRIHRDLWTENGETPWPES